MTSPTKSRHFLACAELTLLELAEFRSLADRFAPRFLREASIFPFETGDGAVALAAGDPADEEALQAAELVFGGPFEIVTASFEDIATILGDKLDFDAEAAAGGRERRGGADENIDNLRDLASGAPVVRAVNDLIEKAVELRASDIHIEPFRDGLNVRMRVDGCCERRPRRPTCCRKRWFRASRFSPDSTSQNGVSRKTARRDCGRRRPISTFVSPRCRLSTANPRSSAYCHATVACSTFPSWV